MRPRVLTVVSVFVGIGACADSALPDREIAIDGRVYSIPNDLILPDVPQAIVGSPEELDSESRAALNLKISVSELGLLTSGGYGYKDTFVVFLYEGDDVLPADVGDAWNRSGLFQNRIIEREPQSDLYRIYPESGYPIIWHLFNADPRGAPPVEMKWVAGCRGSIRHDGPNPADFICSTNVTDGALIAKITFDGARLQELQQIRVGMMVLLIEWRGPI